VRVLLSVASIDPSYGGPAFSVTQLAKALSDQGASVGLWAADGSATSSPLAPGGVAALGGPARGVLDAFPHCTILHDNGIWLPHNHRLRRLAEGNRLPRMVSTRGMLEPWAFQHKGLKKRLAWRLYQRSDLRKAASLHATSEVEAVNLRRLDLGVPVLVAPNGVEPAPANDRRAERPIRTALFLGRLYPVKGLPLLLEAWSQVRPADWRLVIAGPDEAGHRAELERLVVALGLASAVEFTGALAGEAKQKALLAADLFVLPSYSESFGMAVGEALAHGLPVLTTLAVPWPELEQQDCGWRVAPTVEGLCSGLVSVTQISATRLQAMGAAGRSLICARYAWSTIAARFLASYQAIISGESRAAV